MSIICIMIRSGDLRYAFTQDTFSFILLNCVLCVCSRKGSESEDDEYHSKKKKRSASKSPSEHSSSGESGQCRLGSISVSCTTRQYWIHHDCLTAGRDSMIIMLSWSLQRGVTRNLRSTRRRERKDDTNQWVPNNWTTFIPFTCDLIDEESDLLNNPHTDKQESFSFLDQSYFNVHVNMIQHLYAFASFHVTKQFPKYEISITLHRISFEGILICSSLNHYFIVLHYIFNPHNKNYRALFLKRSILISHSIFY